VLIDNYNHCDWKIYNETIPYRLPKINTTWTVITITIEWEKTITVDISEYLATLEKEQDTIESIPHEEFTLEVEWALLIFNAIYTQENDEWILEIESIYLDVAVE